MGEKMERQRWQLLDAERPRDHVAFTVVAEVKRGVEMVGPILGQPSSLSDFAHQGQRRTARDGVDAQPVAGIVAVHDLQAGPDAKVGAQHGERFVLWSVNTVHVNRPLSHLHAVHGWAVGGFACDGARGAATRLFGIWKRCVPVFSGKFSG